MVERADEELLVAAGRGDRPAFAALVERHHRKIMSFVSRYLCLADRDTAEDLAQDIFMNAWKSAPAYQPRGRALVWLYRLANNACLNYRRRWRLRRTVSLDGDPAVEERDSWGAGGGASAVVASEEAAGVRAAVAGLPPRERAAIVLRHFHELSYSEIGVVLEISVPAVESLLFRARKRLRAALIDRRSSERPQVLPPLGAE